MVYTTKGGRTVSWPGQTRLPSESPAGLFPGMHEPGKSAQMSDTDLDVVVVVGAVLCELSLCAALHRVNVPSSTCARTGTRDVNKSPWGTRWPGSAPSR